VRETDRDRILRAAAWLYLVALAAVFVLVLLPRRLDPRQLPIPVMAPDDAFEIDTATATESEDGDP
jgi:hypothetical protein